MKLLSEVVIVRGELPRYFGVELTEGPTNRWDVVLSTVTDQTTRPRSPRRQSGERSLAAPKNAVPLILFLLLRAASGRTKKEKTKSRIGRAIGLNRDSCPDWRWGFLHTLGLNWDSFPDWRRGLPHTLAGSVTMELSGATVDHIA